MAFISKAPAPPQSRLGFTINNFAGGFVNDVAHSLMKDNQSPDLLNMAFKDDGTLEKRRGFVKYKEIEHPTGNVTYIDTFHKLDGSDILITQAKQYDQIDQNTWGDVYRVFVNGVLLCETKQQMQGVNYIGKYYFVDGEKIRVYDGEKLLEVVNTPTSYTPPTEDNRAKGEPKSNETSTWYEPCKRENEDPLLGVNKVPPKPTLITVSKDRLVLSGVEDNKNYVYLSDVFNPVYFPASLPVQPAPTGDKVTGLYTFMDSLVISRNDDIYVLYGNSLNGEGAEGFRLKKINTHTGIPNQFCADIAHNYLFFLGSDGKAYRMHTTQTNTDVLATAILSRGINLFTYPINQTMEQIKKARTHFSVVDGNWYIHLSNKILIYNYLTMSWVIWSNNRTSFCKSHKGGLLFGASHGIILYPRNEEEVLRYKIEKEYADYDELMNTDLPYVCYWKSRNLDMGTPIRYKQFRDVFVVAHTFDYLKSDINVTFEIDYADVSGAMSITNVISRWGKAIFGNRFITRNVVRSEPFVIGQRGKTFSFMFGNGYDIHTNLNNYESLLALTETREGRVYLLTSDMSFWIRRNGEYVQILEEDLYQPLRVYEVSGLYELRGYR